MKTSVVILTDIHYSSDGPLELSSRRGDLSHLLLLRAVLRVNRYIKPDLVLCLGDCVNDADLGDTRIIADILALLECPYMVIPGNHDCSTTDFFSVMPENPDYLDINGLRFIPFCDEEEPEYNASRSPEDLQRLRALAENFDGPVVSCQHVPLFQPGSVDCPYNYTNAETVIETMKTTGDHLTLAGHYHHGFLCRQQPFGTAIAVPCICEAPYRFWELVIDSQLKVECVDHQLSLPADLNLVDWHVHSHFAYCNENMDFGTAVELAKMLSLKGLSFTEHSAHLYYSLQEYGDLKPFKPSGNQSHSACHHNRMREFFQEANQFRTNNILTGLEIDCDFAGQPIVLSKDAEAVDFRMGAIHRLPDQFKADLPGAKQCFKRLVEHFTEYPMRALAHPFRIFRRSGLALPPDLYAFVARLLKQHNIAAELNFHTNEPPMEFFRICMECGVKLIFGSDSHNLYEVGEFYPHLEFLKEIGGVDPSDVLLTVPELAES